MWRARQCGEPGARQVRFTAHWVKQEGGDKQHQYQCTQRAWKCGPWRVVDHSVPSCVRAVKLHCPPNRFARARRTRTPRERGRRVASSTHTTPALRADGGGARHDRAEANCPRLPQCSVPNKTCPSSPRTRSPRALRRRRQPPPRLPVRGYDGGGVSRKVDQPAVRRTHKDTRALTRIVRLPSAHSTPAAARPRAAHSAGSGGGRHAADQHARRAVALARLDALDSDVPADVGDDVLFGGLSFAASYAAGGDDVSPGCARAASRGTYK